MSARILAYDMGALNACTQLLPAVLSAALGYNPFTDFAGRPEYAHLIPKLKPWVRHDCMRADNGYIQFGIKDLVLSVRGCCTTFSAVNIAGFSLYCVCARVT